MTANFCGRRSVKVALLLSVSSLGLLAFSSREALADVQACDSDNLCTTFVPQSAGNGLRGTAISGNGLFVTGVETTTGGNQVAYRWDLATNTLQLLGTLGGPNSIPQAISSDGKLIVGYSDTATVFHAFLWNGGTTPIDLFSGEAGPSAATGVSSPDNAADAVVVGWKTISGGGTSQHAFVWNQTDGTTIVPTLPGGTSNIAYGVSRDGTIVVGKSDTTAIPGGADQAFQWTKAGGTTPLTAFGGFHSSASYVVNADGHVYIAGEANSSSSPNVHAVWWKDGNPTDLKTLGGPSSTSFALSADGSTVVGYSDVAGGAFHAFRSQDGMLLTDPSTDLKTLGGTNSFANAVSQHGGVVVGASQVADGSYQAFLWTASKKMQSIPIDILKGQASNYNLEEAVSVSDDGTVIAGNGTLSGKPVVWIIHQNAGGGAGITTPEQTTESVQSSQKNSQTAATVQTDPQNQAMQSASQGSSSQLQNGQYSVTVGGGWNSDPAAMGTFGVTHKLANGILIGGYASAVHIQTPMPYAPSSYFDGGIGTFLVGSMPAAGWQWLVAGSGMVISGTANRGYPNGTLQSYSTGHTSGRGIAVSGRIGYSFDVLPSIRLTPFASYTYNTISFDGYTETGGFFPATIGAVTDTSHTSRLGLEERYTFAPGRWIWAGVDWGHRYNGGQLSAMTANVVGVGTVVAPGLETATDWWDATAGAKFAINERLSVEGSFTLVKPFHSFPYAITTAGLSWAF